MRSKRSVKKSAEEKARKERQETEEKGEGRDRHQDDESKGPSLATFTTVFIDRILGFQLAVCLDQSWAR